ncbi:hypothetical protein KUV73_24980 [Mameliella alba]|nr:hypothetical protein [Mameliella alba]MBY6172658.1 hypothetical protein [Mameliella alba]MBY6177640.1 hypothetical protein [Mameliella alba]
MSKPQATDEAQVAAWKDKRAAIAAADALARNKLRAVTKLKPAQNASRGPVADEKSAPDPSAMTEDDKAPPPEAQQKSPAALLLEQAQTDDPLRLHAPMRRPKPVPRRNGSRPWGLFAALVVFPVLVAAIYLIFVATPLYEARSVIAITKSADAGGGASPGLLSGIEKPVNLQEVLRADTFIQSQALMDNLETEMGLVTKLSGEAIDPLRRLRTIPFFSVSKHSQFDRFVESSVDVQSGLLTLYVRAPSYDEALAVSDAVLRNAEAQVSRLGQTLFDQRQSHATGMRAAAETEVRNAQAALLALQIKYQDVDPKKRVENTYDRIHELELELSNLDKEIQKARISGIGDSKQTEKMIVLAKHIEEQIDAERAKLVSTSGLLSAPLNNIVMEYDRAALDLELAHQAVKTAIAAQVETSREAALNRSVFQVVVPPSAAQSATFPRRFETLTFVLLVCLTFFVGVATFRSG